MANGKDCDTLSWMASPALSDFGRLAVPFADFDFYYTYGLFRLAGIVQQIYLRYFHGQTQDKRFASFIHMNAQLERMALQVIDRSPL